MIILHLVFLSEIEYLITKKMINCILMVRRNRLTSFFYKIFEKCTWSDLFTEEILTKIKQTSNSCKFFVTFFSYFLVTSLQSFLNDDCNMRIIMQSSNHIWPRKVFTDRVIVKWMQTRRMAAFHSIVWSFFGI